jgi:hypothetical protein
VCELGRRGCVLLTSPSLDSKVSWASTPVGILPTQRCNSLSPRWPIGRPAIPGRVRQRGRCVFLGSISHSPLSSINLRPPRISLVICRRRNGDRHRGDRYRTWHSVGGSTLTPAALALTPLTSTTKGSSPPPAATWNPTPNGLRSTTVKRCCCDELLNELLSEPWLVEATRVRCCDGPAPSRAMLIR